MDRCYEDRILKDEAKSTTLLTSRGTANKHDLPGGQLQYVHITLEMFVPFDPIIPFLGIYLRKIIRTTKKICVQGCSLQCFLKFINILNVQ